MMISLFCNANNAVPSTIMSHFLFNYQASKAIILKTPAWCQAKVKFANLLLNKLDIKSREASCAFRFKEDYDNLEEPYLDNIKYYEKFGINKKDIVDHSILCVNLSGNETYLDVMNPGNGYDDRFLGSFFADDKTLNEKRSEDEQIYILSGKERSTKEKSLYFTANQKRQIYVTMLAKYLKNKNYNITNPVQSVEAYLESTKNPIGLFKACIDMNTIATIKVDNLDHLKLYITDRKKVKKIVSKTPITLEEAKQAGYSNASIIKCKDMSLDEKIKSLKTKKESTAKIDSDIQR